MAKEKKPTQCDEVINWFNDHKSISQVEAIKFLGIMRLASRVSDLKKKGYVFDKEMVSFKTRLGRNGAYAKYYLIKN